MQLCMNKISSSFKSNVFAANQIPIWVNLPAFIISNLDPDTKPGSHWVAIHVDVNGIGEYFDSFGRKPTGYHKLFLKRNAKRWFYNYKSLQNHFTSVCGEYCLVYLYFKYQGKTMYDFLTLFSNNSLCNDLVLRTLFKSVFMK
jgi:hypothetical protein